MAAPKQNSDPNSKRPRRLPSTPCSASSELVQRWLEKELRNVRYWCVAGPAGSGWHEHNIQDKPGYEARRDWIEMVLGSSIESDPWKDRRISEQNAAGELQPPPNNKK